MPPINKPSAIQEATLSPSTKFFLSGLSDISLIRIWTAIFIERTSNLQGPLVYKQNMYCWWIAEQLKLRKVW